MTTARLLQTRKPHSPFRSSPNWTCSCSTSTTTTFSSASAEAASGSKSAYRRRSHEGTNQEVPRLPRRRRGGGQRRRLGEVPSWCVHSERTEDKRRTARADHDGNASGVL